MLKTGKPRIIVCILAFVFAFMGFFSNLMAEASDPSSKIRDRLNGISSEEKQVLEKLFAQMHEIEEMQKEEESLTRDIESLNKEISSLEASIAIQEKAYAEKSDVLKQVLQTYQRRGPGSYLEIILDSENLSMLLWRISTLQDLSRNTEGLLESLEKSKEKLRQEKTGLTQKLTAMGDKQKQLKESIDKKLMLKEESEKYLASLSQQKGYYEKQLNNLQQEWDELKLLFSDISSQFSTIIKEKNIPEDAVKTTFSFKGIEGTIDEITFNSIITRSSKLSEINFRFHDDKVEITVPNRNLMLSGTFEILNGNTLKFVPDSGSFYGISLEPQTIEELFKDGYLTLDLKPLIGSSTLNSIEITEGYMKFVIKPVF